MLPRAIGVERKILMEVGLENWIGRGKLSENGNLLQIDLI
jgi:hypothetical protein